jgi:uncharacterized protein
MRLTYDPQKRSDTLEHRKLDFDDAAEVLVGRNLTIEDDRHDYGEVRCQTVGRLRDAVVMVVWTERGDARHIISMRKCNARERKKYLARLDRS